MSSFRLFPEGQDPQNLEDNSLVRDQTEEIENSPLIRARSHLLSFLILTFFQELFTLIGFFVMVYRGYVWLPDNESIKITSIMTLICLLISIICIFLYRKGREVWLSTLLVFFVICSVALYFFFIDYFKQSFSEFYFGTRAGFVLGLILRIALLIAMIRFLINLKKSTEIDDAININNNTEFLNPFIILINFIIWTFLYGIRDCIPLIIMSLIFGAEVPQSGLVFTIIDVILIFISGICFICVQKQRKIKMLVVAMIFFLSSFITYVVANVILYKDRVVLEFSCESLFYSKN